MIRGSGILPRSAALGKLLDELQMVRVNIRLFYSSQTWFVPALYFVDMIFDPPDGERHGHDENKNSNSILDGDTDLIRLVQRDISGAPRYLGSHSLARTRRNYFYRY